MRLDYLILFYKKVDQIRRRKKHVPMNPYITRLLVGQVRQVGIFDAANPMDRQWATGIFKEPVAGEIWLGKTGLANDEVADTKHHGGPEKAVFAYPISHYDYWKTLPGLETASVGGMGENMAVDRATEDQVCLGDVYQFHHAIIQVSQPRQPCWKPARRFQVKDLALQTQQSGRTGWYFRVLQEGYVMANIELVLIERPTPRWTIDFCNQVMHQNTQDLDLASELARHPHLSESWKGTLNNRIKGRIASADTRLHKDL